MAFDNQRPGPGARLRGLATRVTGTRNRQRQKTATSGGAVEPATPGTGRPVRPQPVLRWKHPTQAPTGAFTACAVPNAQLRVHAIPERGDTWDAVSSFSLSYDGYAYWDEGLELATRCTQAWTRHHTLPASIDEVRACLFYEQRRWHHFGEEPNGRSAQYVWALLDTLRSLVAARTVAEPTGPKRPTPTAVAAPGTSSVRSFLDDDAGYLAWAAEHASGFVVNADRTLSPNSLMLHRASCSCIEGPASPGRTRTANYRKVCASDVDALIEWCRTDIGIDPGCCRHCRPRPSPAAP